MQGLVIGMLRKLALDSIRRTIFPAVSDEPRLRLRRRLPINRLINQLVSQWFLSALIVNCG